MTTFSSGPIRLGARTTIVCSDVEKETPRSVPRA